MTTTITPEAKLAIVRHLANGKSPEVAATIVHTDADTVRNIAKSHGYPDREKLAWAADVLARRIEDGEDEHLAAKPLANVPSLRPRGESVTSPTPRAAPAPQPATLTRPDELRVLLNTAKQHPAKRIQNAADRIFDQLDRLRELIRADEEKNAAKRKATAEKEAARAEVERLEEQLRCPHRDEAAS